MDIFLIFLCAEKEIKTHGSKTFVKTMDIFYNGYLQKKIT